MLSNIPISKITLCLHDPRTYRQWRNLTNSINRGSAKSAKPRLRLRVDRLALGHRTNMVSRTGHAHTIDTEDEEADSRTTVASREDLTMDPTENMITKGHDHLAMVRISSVVTENRDIMMITMIEIEGFHLNISKTIPILDDLFHLQIRAFLLDHLYLMTYITMVYLLLTETEAIEMSGRRQDECRLALRQSTQEFRLPEHLMWIHIYQVTPQQIQVPGHLGACCVTQI